MQVAGIVIHSRILGVNYFTLLLERHQSQLVPFAAKVYLSGVICDDMSEIAGFIHSLKHIEASFTKRNDVVTEVRLNG